jgi:hypothetical protein
MVEAHAQRRGPARPNQRNHQEPPAHAIAAPGLVAVPGLVGGHDLVPLRRRADRDATTQSQGCPAPLRRVISIDKKKVPPKGKLPTKPKGVVDQKLLPAVTELATTWQRDGEDHSFATTEEFYQALVKAVTNKDDGKTPKQNEGEKARHAKGKAPWPTIIHASTVEGKVESVDWSSFDTDGADALLTELLEATVQISSNTETTACHGNAHRKLPKPVDEALQKPLASMPEYKQPDHTDYIELLIRGHKKESGIERGIIDRKDGSLYLTAHYDKGSFVQLINAPGNLVADWQGKAEKYCQLLKSFAPQPK